MAPQNVGHNSNAAEPASAAGGGGRGVSESAPPHGAADGPTGPAGPGRDDAPAAAPASPGALARRPAAAALAPEAPGPAYLCRLRHLGQQHSMARLAAQYLAEEVLGLQSPNTFAAKGRDLAAFIAYFVDLNGHGEIGSWMPRDTQAYLNALEGHGRAPTSVNRALASLRHFSRWAHELPGHVFERHGLPCRGVKALVVDEADCKKLSRREMHQLFKAADALVDSERRRNARPRRNRAILGLLYYTGLRVSELVALQRRQLQGNHLTQVARKGKTRSKGLYLVAECRRLLAAYLDEERPADDPTGGAAPLLLGGSDGGYMTRQLVAHVLRHIAEEAAKHRAGPEGRIAIHPHRLRHTFGSEYRERSGSDTETAAALGHASLQYVGRYVRRTQEEREAALERTFGG